MGNKYRDLRTLGSSSISSSAALISWLPVKDIISEDKTMVVGVDVTHPSSCSAPNAPSIAGMVASVDKRLGQWPADLRIQESRQEMVSELDSMLESRLDLWKSQGNHAAFPRKPSRLPRWRV